MPKQTRAQVELEMTQKAADDFSKIEDLKAALKRAEMATLRNKARKADLVEAVMVGARDALLTLDLTPVAAPKLKDTRPGRDETAVAVIADWQLGKRTPTYSSKVCEERIELYGDKVIELTNIQRKDHPVRKCHVWALGDIVEGELIFPGASHLIDSSLYAQTVKDGPRILGNFLRKMLANFDSVHFVGVIGNHGAIGGRERREYNAESNADRMLYTITRSILEASGQDRITFNIPDGSYERNWYAIDTIGAYKSLLLHGDQFRGRSGIPVAQMVKKVALWSMGGIAERFDDVAFGHYHQPTRVTVNTATVRCSGSPESDNSYASEGLAAVGRPSQPLMFVSGERGQVTAEYQVWLAPPLKRK